MVENWTLFIKSMKIENLEEIVHCPLWKISHVSYNVSLDWYNKGTRN